jgi:ectoine hydroxylase-related dioxygenase (phytanoyl-CoA dioxygenase family)
MTSTVHDLASMFAVDSDQCAKFRHDGFLFLRSVATPEEIEYFHPRIIRLADEYARTRAVRSGREEIQPLFEYVPNVWRKDDELKEFILSPRFARIAAELMGVARVRLYHDEAILKDPRGFPAPWHKDHLDWPLSTHNTVKMWLAIADVTLEMAPIRFAVGSHHGGRFPEVFPSYESDELFDRIIHDHNIPVVAHAMEAGDAIFFSGEILHSTRANSSNRRREALAIIYFADGARVMAPNNEYRRADMEEFLPGLTPGDLAASALNPCVYPVEHA